MSKVRSIIAHELGNVGSALGKAVAKKTKRKNKNKNKNKKINSLSDQIMLSAPVNTGKIIRKSAANFNKSKTIVIRNREYVRDINGSVGFVIQMADLVSPSSTVMFPWLRRVAKNFECYKFKNLRFCFETSTSTATTGTVGMVMDYQATDVNEDISKQALLDDEGAVRAQPWISFHFDASQTGLNIRNKYYVSQTLGSGDNDLIYTGAFYLFTDGQATTAKIGEIFVEYEVELFINAGFDLNETDFVYYQGSTPTSANPLGTLASLTGSGIAMGYSVNFMSFNHPGEYQVITTIVAASSVNPLTFAITAGTGNVTSGIYSTTGTAVTMVRTLVRAVTPLTISVVGTIVAGTAVYQQITPWPYGAGVSSVNKLESLLKKYRLTSDILDELDLAIVSHGDSVGFDNFTNTRKTFEIK